MSFSASRQRSPPLLLVFPFTNNRTWFTGEKMLLIGTTIIKVPFSLFKSSPQKLGSRRGD